MENITEAEKYQLFKDVIETYVGLWSDVNYSVMEMPIGITINKIDHYREAIQYTLNTHQFGPLFRLLDDFDYLTKLIVSNERCNMEVFYDTFMRHLNASQIDEIEGCGYDGLEDRFQKVLNILFEDYYSLRRMYSPNQ
jgi:hypothetical protein